MNETQKRKLAEAGYPGRDLRQNQEQCVSKLTLGRDAEAVKKHIELRKGQ